MEKQIMYRRVNEVYQYKPVYIVYEESYYYVLNISQVDITIIMSFSLAINLHYRISHVYLIFLQRN